MAQYRAVVIGLGWMGMLYDLAQRTGTWHVDDINRPTPELDLHRKFHHYDHPGTEGLPSSYSEALWDRPEVDLVAVADRDTKRLQAFTTRYGVDNVYDDAVQMLHREKADIVVFLVSHKEFLEFLFLTVEHYNQYWYNKLQKANKWSEYQSKLPK